MRENPFLKHNISVIEPSKEPKKRNKMESAFDINAQVLQYHIKCIKSFKYRVTLRISIYIYIYLKSNEVQFRYNILWQMNEISFYKYLKAIHKEMTTIERLGYLIRFQYLKLSLKTNILYFALRLTFLIERYQMSYLIFISL